MAVACWRAPRLSVASIWYVVVASGLTLAERWVSLVAEALSRGSLEV